MHTSNFCISIHNSDALFQYKTYGEIKLVLRKSTQAMEKLEIHH